VRPAALFKNAKRHFFLGTTHAATRPGAWASSRWTGSQTALTRRPRFPQPSRAIFFDVVAACDRDHFRPSDLPLVVRYVEAAALGDQAAAQLRLGAVITGKPSPWITVQEKAVRAMVALSMRLRLSPQSRIDAKTLGRQEVRQGPAPWEYGDNARR